jgi:RNA polymerase sigma-70 factor (ECF subfamily)
LRSSPPRETGFADDAEALYLRYRPLLLYVAGRKFGIDRDDAEPLVQEVLLAFLTTTIVLEKPKAWLIATMCNASRGFWRRRALLDRIEGTCLSDADYVPDGDVVEKIDRRLLLQRILSLLCDADRELLRLHYFEQLTAMEIAPLLGTTAGYAEKRIGLALKRVRRLYFELDTRGVARTDGGHLACNASRGSA